MTSADISYIAGCARDYNSDLFKDSTAVSEPLRVSKGGSPYSDVTQQSLTGFREGFVAYGLTVHARV